MLSGVQVAFYTTTSRFLHWSHHSSQSDTPVGAGELSEENESIRAAGTFLLQLTLNTFDSKLVC